MLILFETYVFYKGNLDRLSLAIRTAPVFQLSHMVELDASDMMILIEAGRFLKEILIAFSLQFAEPPVFKLTQAHMVSLGFSRSRGFHHF